MSKVISPILTDGTGMAIAQAINHNTATQLALNTNSYDESETLLEVQDARTINETQYTSLGEAIRAEVTRIDGELGVVNETLETHTNNITEVTDKANKNATNIAKVNDNLNGLTTPKWITLYSDAGTIAAGYCYKVGRLLILSAQIKVENQVTAWDTSVLKFGDDITFNNYGIPFQQIVGYVGSASSYDTLWVGQWETRTKSLKSAKNINAGGEYIRVSFVTICD